MGQADPLEEEMASCSSILDWKIPGTEEPGRLQSMGSQRVGMTERLHFHFSLSCIGEGNDTLPGSSPSGSREFEGWTALAWKDLFIY